MFGASKSIHLALYFLIIIWSVFNVESKKNDKNVFKMVVKGIKEYFRTSEKPDYFLRALEKYQLPYLLQRDMEERANKPQLCYLCNIAASFLVAQRIMGFSQEFILAELLFLCTAMGISTPRICKGLIENNIGIFIYIIDNRQNLTTARICGSIFQNLHCDAGDNFEWSLEVPAGTSRERPELSNPSSKTFKILHLTDIHYDPKYKVNGNAACGEVLCCQDDQGEPKSEKDACGYWGDYRNADAPWHLITKTLEHLKTQEFDFVYYTGDIISHRVWSTSIPSNTEDIIKIFSYFKQEFQVPVYPVLGNHEPHPLNVWTSEAVKDQNFSDQWIFETILDQWTPWLGSDVKPTILHGGFYTVNPRKGFRIIALNGNVCYTFNWWLIYDDHDPYDQLEWLIATLKLAEDNNESVHILNHVPAGSSECLKVWAREYQRIIERFSRTITGHFHGHTHEDQFYIYYNSSSMTEPVGVAFNGAALTPHINSNPSYKIYEVNSDTFTLLDYEEWTFNLTQANSQPDKDPEWFKLYSFREAYGVEDLQPKSLEQVPFKMSANRSLINLYYNYKYRQADPYVYEKKCDENCEKDIICEITTTLFDDTVQCNYFQGLYNNSDVLN